MGNDHHDCCRNRTIDAKSSSLKLMLEMLLGVAAGKTAMLCSRSIFLAHKLLWNEHKQL